MKRFTKLSVMLAIVGVMSLFGSTSAYAASAGVITGAGTITPGVPGPTGGTVSNSVTFTGTATGVFNNTPGSCAISFSGGGTDSTLVGSGSGNATCTGPGVNISCTLSYTRVGVTVIVSGGCNVGTLVGAFVFVPNNVNPTTSYQLVGSAVTAP